MTADVIFFALFGLLSIAFGLRNSKSMLWQLFGDQRGLEKILGKNYPRVINIAMGIVSILVSVLLYLKN